MELMITYRAFRNVHTNKTNSPHTLVVSHPRTISAAGTHFWGAHTGQCNMCKTAHLHINGGGAGGSGTSELNVWFPLQKWCTLQIEQELHKTQYKKPVLLSALAAVWPTVLSNEFPVC